MTPCRLWNLGIKYGSAACKLHARSNHPTLCAMTPAPRVTIGHMLTGDDKMFAGATHTYLGWTKAHHGAREVTKRRT